MDEYGRMKTHKHKKAGIAHKLLMVVAVIVIILVAVFAYYFLGGPINVSGPTTLTLNGQGTVFSMGGKSYVATLEGFNSNTDTAYVYLSALPVFLGPLLNVTLHHNSTVKINYGSQFAIMQMILLSGNGNSASVQVSPLASSLQVSPDYQYIGHPNVSMPGLQITVTTTTSVTTTVASGANASGSTSTASTAPTTSIRATTTAVQAANNGTATAIQTALVGDPSYGLMLNFSTIYSASLTCTQNLYNSDYFGIHSVYPSGQLGYYNVSHETPYGLVQKTVSKGGGNYDVEFLALVDDPQFNNTAALTIALTIAPLGSTTVATVNSNVFGGVFEGATYSTLASEYAQTKEVGNACAALVG